jgi:Cu(I)/Ag(I) efflux system membrane fusion protein
MFAVSRVAAARLRFVAVFLAAALVVGYWGTIQNYLDKWTRPPVAPDLLAQASDVEYYCVMHANVVRSEPGNCPICGMPLAKRKKGEAVPLPAGVYSRVQLTPQRIALAGVQTTPVVERDLIREIRAVATLDYDETRVAQLSARVPGRVDELFVKSIGEHVRKGDQLYSIYSPDVYTSQREYLMARKRARELPANTPEDVRHDTIEVYNASMQKLVLWGATSDDLDRLDKQFDESGQVPTHFIVTSPIAGTVVKKPILEGGYVQTGDVPYTIADLSNLWLQVRIYEPDVPLVKLGERVDITVDGMANTTFTGKITFLAFQVDPATRTLAARVEIANPNLQLRPGLFADALIRVPVLPPGPSPAASSQPAGAASPDVLLATQFRDALEPYLKAHRILASDKTEGVPQALQELLTKLEPLKARPELAERVARIAPIVQSSMTAANDLEKQRKAFREVSAEMIALGATTGVPASKPVRVFRCPMGDKPNWLQVATETINPYQGTQMLDCGAQIDTLPRIAPPIATRPQNTGTRLLSIPRSAVIIAGARNVVFVADPQIDGAFDMKNVKIGPLATVAAENGAEYYPVLNGLESGDRVVTAGAFLLDAENRLNGGGIATAEPAPSAPSVTTNHAH